METEQSYTEGPWRSTVTWYAFKSDGKRFKGNCGVTVLSSKPEIIANGYGKSTEEAFANARLISSAPDLLSAAKWLVKLGNEGHITINPMGQGLFNMFEEAIAKAEG